MTKEIKISKLYSSLNPTQRIPRVIKEYIFPSLEELGFRVMKSGLSIKRDINHFKQDIWFSKSKWNIEDAICAFTPHFTVTIKGYKRWHKTNYNLDPLNDVLGSKSANYIGNWDNELFEDSDYDLSKDDNLRIVELVKTNILMHGIEYLNRLSNYKQAIKFLKKENRYYVAPKMVDLCLMENDIELAKSIIEWFYTYQMTGKSQFREDTIEDMKVRRTKIN